MAGISATYISISSFSVIGNQTAEFDVGRRVKCVGGSTTWYGTILSSVYTTLTTVTLTAASDDLGISLTEVYYGIVSGTETSSATNIHTHDGDEGSGGQIDHVNLDNIGTNNHSAIDAHISDVTTNPHNISVPLTTKGDVLGYDTEATRLSVGTDGQVLSADSSEATGIKWVSNPVGFADPMTTRGDIIYKNASNITTRLANGTVGQILTSDGTDIGWEGYTAGGANLSEGTATQIAVDIDSDSGTNATLVSASTSRAGLLTKAKFDEIVANTSKVSNVTHTGEVTGNTTLTIADNMVDEANLKLDEGAVNDYVLTADSTKSGGMKWASNPYGFNDPMTTRGDVIIRNSSNSTDKLSIGTNGQVLTSDGTDISWESNTGGNVSTSGTPVDNDFAKFVDGTDIEGRSYTEVKSDLAITASDVTDFDTEVANNSAVAANTSKVTNVSTNITVVEAPTNVEIQSSDGSNDTIAAANVTNAGVMTTTMYDEHVVNNDKVTYNSTDSTKVGHISVTQAVNLDTMESDISTNNAKVTNATHSGEVTGDGALTIADNIIDEANLKLDTGPTNDYILTADSTKSGGMKWAAATSGGGANLSEGTATTTTVNVNSDSGTNATLVAASTSRAGLLTKDKFDEIVANTSKVGNLPTNLSTYRNSTEVTIQSSDGTDAAIPVATDEYAGIVDVDLYDEIGLNSSHRTSTTGNPHNVDMDDIYIESVYSTDVTIQQLINKSQATGYFDSDNSGWFGANKGFTNNGDGTLDVAGGHGILRENDTAEDTAYFVGFLPETGPGLTMVDKSTNYIYVEWSSSVAVDIITTTTERTDLRTNILLGKVYRDGLDMEFFYGGNYIAELGENIVERFNDQDGVITRTSGAVVTETGTRNIAFSDAITYNGLLKHPITGYDTNVSGTFEYYYYNGSSWINSSQTAIDSANYNDTASGLTALSAGEYGVHWVFITSAGSMLVVYGQDSYTLANAEAAQIPASLPELVEEFSFLAAKIIIAKNATTFTEIQSSYDTSFQSGVDVDAEDVAITDSGSYYTGSDVEAALQEIGASNVSTSGTPVDNDFAKFTDATTIEGRSYSEVKTDLAITGTDVAVTDTNDYYDGSNVEAILDEIGETRLISGYDLTDDTTLPDLVFTNGTRLFEVKVQGGESDFSFWVNNHKYTKTTTQDVTIPNVTGTYYIYFDNSGVLQYIIDSSVTAQAFYEFAITGIVYWNATAGTGFAGDERHGKLMDGRTHHFNHATFGARYESGLDITGLVDGEVDYTNTTSGYFWDEDIRHELSLQTTHPFLYRLGATGEWTGTTADSLIGFKNGTADVVWNEWTGTTWQLTQSGAQTDYMIYFMIATPDLSGYNVKKIIGQNGYSSRANARAAIETEMDSIIMDGLPSPEFIFLNAYIVRRNGDLENLADGSTHVDLRSLKGGTATSAGATSIAADVTTSTTNFDTHLSTADTNVQAALDTLDDHDHTASQVTDFDTEVANNSAVAANTSKVGVTDEISDLVDDTSPQLGNTLDLNENYIQLKPVPASDESGSGDIANMTVDVNDSGVAAALYMASDGNFEEADASSDTTLPCMAIALEFSTGSKDVLLKGFMRDDSWNWTSIGQPVYVSTTAGGFTQTAPSTSGEFVQRVGIATHADRIFFNPDYTIIEIA